MTEEKYNISPLTRQMVLRVLGSYCSTYNGNDIYYLIRAIYLLISDLGENIVKESWEKEGNNWESTKHLLIKADKRATEIKAYYDKIEDKKMVKKKQELEAKRFYTRTASKMPIINFEIYKLFIFLTKKTEINRSTIPSEAFKILEHLGRKPIEFGKKPIKQMTEVSHTTEGV